MSAKIAIIDIETTGTHLERDRITEIGVVLLDNMQVVDEWSSFVQTEGVEISNFITQLTGIRNEQCQSAPLFNELAEQLQDRLHDRVMYAHNARFDYAFLKKAFERVNIQFTMPAVCTLRLSRLLYPTFAKHNLDALRERFNLPTESRHRALGDAKTVQHFLQKVHNTFATEKIEDVLSGLRKGSATPPQLNSIDIEQLPNSNGVYIFKDSADVPLYVGKSIKLRKRVQSHFYTTTKKSKELELFQRVAKIGVVETATEFEALVLESSMIKSLMPVFNRRLRKKSHFCQLSLDYDEAGYYQVTLKRNMVASIQVIDGFTCLFKNTRTAKTVLQKLGVEYNLCLKMLGLEATRSVCFNYHLGICKGACKRSEEPSAYNQRLLQGLQRYLIETWPYKTPILTSENNDRYHLIYKWCYIDSFDSQETAAERLKDVNFSFEFDLDQYKIVRQYLRQPNLRISQLEF